MTLMYQGIVLCSSGWRSMSASEPVVLKQYVKKLRVNSSIVHTFRSSLDGDNNTILGMVWKGLFGYMYIMKKLDDVMVVKAESQLFIPSDVCEFEDFGQTLESLMKFKSYYVGLALKIKAKAAKDRREQFIISTTSGSPSPQTVFTPKWPTTTQTYYQEHHWKVVL
ncbi:unnamed protein product [Mucor hiemalis]